MRWVHLNYVKARLPYILPECRDAIYRVSTNMRLYKYASLQICVADKYEMHKGAIDPCVAIEITLEARGRSHHPLNQWVTIVM